MLDSGIGSGIATLFIGYYTYVYTSRWLCICSSDETLRFNSHSLHLCVFFVMSCLIHRNHKKTNAEGDDGIIFDIHCIYLNLPLTLSLPWPRTQVAKSFWLAEANVMAIAVKLYGPLPSRHFSQCQDSHE